MIIYKVNDDAHELGYFLNQESVRKYIQQNKEYICQWFTLDWEEQEFKELQSIEDWKKYVDFLYDRNVYIEEIEIIELKD